MIPNPTRTDNFAQDFIYEIIKLPNTVFWEQA